MPDPFAPAVPRRSFERVLPNTLVEYSMTGGIGCDIPAANETAQGKPVSDDHIHEHGTCLKSRIAGWS